MRGKMVPCTKIDPPDGHERVPSITLTGVEYWIFSEGRGRRQRDGKHFLTL